MREFVPVILVFCALTTLVLSIFGEDGYAKVLSQRNSLAIERQQNKELRERVTEIRRAVRELRRNDRALEKTVRNELGMARPDEVVVIFEAGKE